MLLILPERVRIFHNLGICLSFWALYPLQQQLRITSKYTIKYHNYNEQFVTLSRGSLQYKIDIIDVRLRLFSILVSSLKTWGHWV